MAKNRNIFDEAIGLEKNGKYKSALKKYMEVGGVYRDKALYRIGQMYRKGKGCATDYNKAVEIFYELAERGNIDGEYMIGLLYFEGEGVEQDYKKAMYWHQKAGNQGSRYAQYSVGIMYENGWGCVEDIKKAFEWYYRAAEQEYGTAQYRVACHYYFGLAVEQDIKKAKEWFKKSSDNGFVEAKYNLACILLDEEENLKDAVNLLVEVAKTNHWMAAYNLFLCAINGFGMKKDEKYAEAIGKMLSGKNREIYEERINDVKG